MGTDEITSCRATDLTMEVPLGDSTELRVDPNPSFEYYMSTGGLD